MGMCVYMSYTLRRIRYCIQYTMLYIVYIYIYIYIYILYIMGVCLLFLCVFLIYRKRMNNCPNPNK